MTASSASSRVQRGFTLAELALVLLVVAILLGGLLAPLSSQVDQRNVEETRARLTTIEEALLGFAAAHGRLPCPAPTPAAGVEMPSGGGICSSPYGYVPGQTLGLRGAEANGVPVDAWNQPIRYAVTASNASAFSTAGGMRGIGMGALVPDLRVCDSSTLLFPNPASPSKCASNESPIGNPNHNTLTNDAVVVLLSRGRNGADAPADPDEQVNALPAGRVFVSHARSDDEARRDRFDDELRWLSRYILYSRMISAGQLP